MANNNNTPADDVRIELARTLAENAKPWSFGPEVVDAVMSRFDVRLRGVTPPADDVREALRQLSSDLESVVEREGYYSRDVFANTDALRVAVAALSAVVRPYGTVTDAEVACPHWSPGSVTYRSGCTACEAEAAREARNA